MVTYKDLIEFKGDKNKTICFTCLSKEFTLERLRQNDKIVIDYIEINYSSDGLTIDEIYYNDKVTLNEMLGKLSKISHLNMDENLIFWDEDCSMVNIEEIIELEDLILFI